MVIAQKCAWRSLDSNRCKPWEVELRHPQHESFRHMIVGPPTPTCDSLIIIISVSLMNVNVHLIPLQLLVYEKLMSKIFVA